MRGQDEWYTYKYRELGQDNNKNDCDLKIITEGTLKFSAPADFNDPFDCNPAYCEQSITDLFKNRPELLKKAGKARGLSPAQRILEKPKIIARIRASVNSGAWPADTRASVSVFCTSRNPCIQLMWSHYSGMHTGFVVEFRIPFDAPEQDLWYILPQPVTYADERPLIDWGAKDPDVEQHFLTKHTMWAYEEEERVIDLWRQAGIHAYPREKFLNAVIAGAKMKDAQFNKLKEVVHKAEIDTGRRINLYRAKLSDRTYKVYIPQHPDPQYSCPE